MTPIPFNISLALIKTAGKKELVMLLIPDIGKEISFPGNKPFGFFGLQ
jgi:hypothetical protein